MITDVDVILNGTNPRFDQFEDGGAELWNIPPLLEQIGAEYFLRPCEEV